MRLASAGGWPRQPPVPAVSWSAAGRAARMEGACCWGWPHRIGCGGLRTQLGTGSLGAAPRNGAAPMGCRPLGCWYSGPRCGDGEEP